MKDGYVPMQHIYLNRSTMVVESQGDYFFD
jgi:hypothetical protein